jgi:hypothetical protein
MMNRTKKWCLLLAVAIFIGIVARLLVSTVVPDDVLLAQKARVRESGKQVWEYRVINSPNKQNIVDDANVLAIDGWEIVSVLIAGESGSDTRYAAFLKRLKTQ